MNTTDKMITLARRYCTDNYRFWAEKYQKERTGDDFPYTYTDSDYDMFPRYNVMTAILNGVEALTGKIFNDVNECREELKVLGMESHTTFTSGDNNAIELAAMADERAKFVHFIDQLTPEQIENVAPLPYRRRIIGEEKSKIADALWEHWHFDGEYWEPIVPCSKKPYIFFTKANLNADDLNKIAKILASGTGRMLEVLSEEGNYYEIDCSEFDPKSVETVYAAQNFEWIVYLSHENTITFAGDWLLGEIESQLSDKKDFVNKW